MTASSRLSALDALKQAKLALQNGDRSEAFALAKFAAEDDASLEEAWLILAALSSPDASLQFLKRALQANPASQRARQGIRWALQRKRKAESLPGETLPIRTADRARSVVETTKIRIKKRSSPPSKRSPKKLTALVLSALAVTAVLCLTVAVWLVFSQNWVVMAGANSIVKPAGALLKPSLTPTSSFTPTPTPTQTPTSTPTLTPTVTPTETPTETLTETAIPLPTEEPPALPNPFLPENAVTSGERWIEVNLSQQTLYAYEGDQLVNTFIISSGTWMHPTVTGSYQINARYRTSTMSGEDYYLPNVPYAMYFYKGYALHGTYWHNNFGVPMSHGCINLRTEDAAWLYDWTSIGTLITIHD